MVFSPPSWVPKLPHVPDDVPLCDFMLDERYGRCSLGLSRPPFTCAISGRSYSALEVADRVDHLASAIAKEFGWHPNQGSEWDKVVGIFSLNAVRLCLTIILCMNSDISYMVIAKSVAGRCHTFRMGDPSVVGHCLFRQCNQFTQGAGLSVGQFEGQGALHMPSPSIHRSRGRSKSEYSEEPYLPPGPARGAAKGTLNIQDGITTNFPRGFASESGEA